MSDIGRKAKRTMQNAEDKARDMKDNAQQKLDDIMPGSGSDDKNARNRRRNR